MKLAIKLTYVRTFATTNKVNPFSPPSPPQKFFPKCNFLWLRGVVVVEQVNERALLIPVHPHL